MIGQIDDLMRRPSSGPLLQPIPPLRCPRHTKGRAAMIRSTIASLCAAVSGPTLMEHCRDFALRVKLSGTPDELASLQTVQAALDGFGYRTTLLRHDAYIGLPGPARVEADGRPLAAITHSLGRASPAEGVTGRLVDVGAGRAADFAGKDVAGAIVLADGVASPGVADLVRRHGAAGQLHVSPHELLHEMCISPVWGNPSDETLALLPATVVCTISADDGAALRARLAAGESPAVTLHAQVDIGWRTIPLLVADLDAPHAGADAPFVLFSGHHDTWYFGVMDNGSANATMLECARLLARVRPLWRRGLRLCFWSGHSHGRYAGSAWYVDNHFDDLDRRCVAHVNVDSTGAVGASVVGETQTMAALRALAAEAIAAQAGQTLRGKRKVRSADDSLPSLGVPSMFGSLSGQSPSPMKMPNALGWWWHTADDTLDKIDEANLVRDTRVFLHVLLRLLTAKVVPLDLAAHATDLLAELERIAPALAGRFEIAALTRGANAVREAAAALAARADAADDAEAARINAALMRASRAIVPADYATGDRFIHDPAVSVPPWPALQALRDLAATPAGSDEARFVAGRATRARNRLAHALQEAAGALAVSS
jgi:hypothetical protein